MTGNEIALGEFLRSRRSRLAPADVDVAGGFGARRVPGLRREEVAVLAGVSASYYTRMEQGTASGVSLHVLDAVARALRLDADDRNQLYRLAQVVPASPCADTPGVIAPSIDAVLRHLSSVPAGVLGHDMRVLAWNRLGHLLFGWYLPFEAPWREGVNWARQLFLDERARHLFRDWDRHADDLAGRLRASVAAAPDDAALIGLVAELRASSPAFAELWSAHPVRERPLGEIHLDHPELGPLVLRDAVLRPAERDDQGLFTFHAVPGSPTDERLRDAARRWVTP